MGDWGEDEPGIEAEPFDVDDEPQGPLERREPGRAFGVDIGELATDLVASTFQKAIREQIVDVVGQTVEDAVSEVLDDVTIEDLQLRAGTAALDAVQQQLAALDDEPEPEEEEPEPELYYGSVDEFVREYLIGAYRRRVDGQNRLWAARWWEYDEAVIRLDALWRAWEHLRQDPTTGMSVWWRDHADHHMGVLLSPEGPFAGSESEADRNRKGQPLPYEAPPEGLFVDERVPVDVPIQPAS